MPKIHIDTTALSKLAPSIIVAVDGKPANGRYTFVRIHCPCCGAKTATVEQHGNNAHVIVPREDQIVIEEPEEP